MTSSSILYAMQSNQYECTCVYVRPIYVFPTFRILSFPSLPSIGIRQTQMLIYPSIHLSLFIANIMSYHIHHPLSHIQCAAIVALDSAFCSSSVENGASCLGIIVSVFSSDVSVALRLMLLPLIASGGFPVAVCGLDTPVLAMFVSSTSFSLTVAVSGCATRLFLRKSRSRVASVSLSLWLATLFFLRLATKLVARLWAM